MTDFDDDGPPTPESPVRAGDMAAEAPSGGRRELLVAVGCWVALAVPLIVALVAQRRNEWFPIADLAQTELRVRDVGGRETPLVGLAGRIGPADDPGSHAGPIAYWLLAPVYRLFGATSFGLQASTAALHLGALAACLWLAARRGGAGLVLWVGVLLAVLARFFGTLVLLEPWNPYLPTTWWMLFILAAWSILDDDLVAWPVLVVAGSICAQTHLPYIGLVGGSIVALAVVLGVRWVRARPAEPGERLRRIRWIGASTVLGLALWTAPLLDQFARTGNMSLIVETLLHPGEEPVGLRAGVEAYLRNLDPFALITRTLPIDGSIPGTIGGGLLLIVIWAISAGAARRAADRGVPALHVVVGTSLLLGLVSAAKVTGEIWYYLYLWARTASGFAVFAIVLTASKLASSARRGSAVIDAPPGGGTVARPAPIFGIVALLAITVFGSIQAADGPRSQPGLTGDLGRLVAQTASALDRSGTYQVIWTDRLALGGQGIGMVNELERRGFSVGVLERHGAGAVRHRVLDRGEVDGVIHVVVGEDVAAYDAANPDAIRIASIDDRTPEQIERFAEVTASIERFYERSDSIPPSPDVASNLFVTVVFGDLPPDLVADAGEAIEIAASRVSVYLEPAVAPDVAG